MIEIYSQARMSQTVDDIDEKLKAGKLKVGLDETLWVGLRKKDCWVWQSDKPHCYSGWHMGYPTATGGIYEKNFLK